MPRPRRAALRRDLRIHARDTRHQPVATREIKTRIHPERVELHPRAPHRAGDHAVNARLGIVAHRSVEPGHNDQLGQPLALDPKLKLPRPVTRVRPDLEGDHHHDLRRVLDTARTRKRARERQDGYQ